MSYNITAFKVKKLENFQIPVSAIRDSKYFVKQLVLASNRHSFELDAEEATISGVVADEVVTVDKVIIHGEGSGHIYDDFLDILTKHTAGELVVTIVWEGGDTIEYLTVKNGKAEVIDE